MYFPGGKTPDVSNKARTYTSIMQEQELRRDQVSFQRQVWHILLITVVLVSTSRLVSLIILLFQRGVEDKMREKAKTGELKANGSDVTVQQKKKRRWDQAVEADANNQPTPKRRIDAPATPSQASWAETPGRIAPDATPGSAQTPGTVRHWAETPVHVSAGSMTPGREPTTPGHSGATPSGRRNRWDETPRGTGG